MIYPNQVERDAVDLFEVGGGINTVVFLSLTNMVKKYSKTSYIH